MSDMTQSRGHFRLPDRTVSKAKQFKFEPPDHTFAKSSTFGKAKEREDPSMYELPPDYADMEIELEAEKAKHSGAPTATKKQSIFKKPLFKVWLKTQPCRQEEHTDELRPSAKERGAVSAKMFAYFSRKQFIFTEDPVTTDDTLDPRADGFGRPVLWVRRELVERNGVLELQQSMDVYDVSNEEAKEITRAPKTTSIRT
ncbi:hypothetical protein MBLNU13_g11408t1 [Cladosporium sp. NU13]